MTLKRQLRRNSSRSRSANKASDRRLSHETLERRELLAAGLGVEEGPRLIAVSANSGEQFDLGGNNQLPVSPTELTFRFTGDLVDASTLAGIQFIRSGGDDKFDNDDIDPSNDNGNDIVVTPGFIGFEQDSGTNIIVARFAETLPDDMYVVQFAGYDDTNNGVVGLRDINGNLLHPPNPVNELAPTQRVKFDVEVGPRVVGVVPQPIETSSGTRIQQRNKIWVFFNDDPLALGTNEITSGTGTNLPVVNQQFYKLIYTNDTVENIENGSLVAPIIPTSVTYSPTLNRAELTFDMDLSELAPAAANGNAGTYRLRIGSGDALPAPPTQRVESQTSNDLFSDAQDLGVVFGTGTQSVLLTEGVIQSSEPFVSQWPGATDAVGSRDQRRDTAITGRIDTHTGINLFSYNFAGVYGNDPQGNTAQNAITDVQKTRAREVLDLYSERLGVTFVETEDEGLQIVTGDLRTIVITADTGAGADTPLSIFRVSERDPSQGVLVMDAGENWFDEYGLSPDGRPSWFVEAVRGVGSLLGIGNLFELPAGVGAGGSSPDEPNAVAFSGQYYPNLPVEPSFISHSDVTLGQALHRPESNDVDFYEFSSIAPGRLAVETFAERLDGSSLLDTHVNVYQKIDGQFELIARNDDFYSDDSFVGIDVAAGEFKVGVSASGNESYNGAVPGSGLGGVSEGRYNLRVTFTASTGTTITDTTGTLLDGDADGRQGGDFNFWFRTARDVSAATGSQPRTIFVDKFGDDFSNDGSLGAPLRTIQAALTLSRENDIVRLLPNGGVDGLIETLGDNRAYEIGRGGAGNLPLSDGVEFEVPKGVTVMIDAGAILKLQTAKISVGSDSVDEDRSKASLQVLGQPNRFDANTAELTYQGEVIFTSYDNEAVGFDTNSRVTTPAKGNWAGIEFRNDFDYAEGQPVWETEGIFLDYVSHANISYGGGSVNVNDPLIINPIHLSASRPTLIYNTITESADAAISADPNSFLETNFHTPVFQRAASFTSDYDRVGPEISGNRLFDNSFNSLFVRVETPAGGQREQLTVSGRFDDTDIVHTLSEVLEVRGQSGGPILLEQRPNVLSAVLTSAPSGPAAAGMTGTLPAGSYNYKVTYVDELGNESLASLPTESMSASADGFLTIDNLPTAPSEYSGRRLYRIDPTATSEVYVFVTQLDRASTTYVDNGDTRGGILRGEERPLANGVTLSDGNGFGTLFPGDAYSYRFTFVDGIGGESQASVATTTFVAPTNGAITLDNLPGIPDGFNSLDVYRLDPTSGDYFLIVQLDANTTSYDDVGVQIGRLLTNDGSNGALLSPRLNARLSIDPGTIVKLQNARIDVGLGATFYAEGFDGQEVIFTSRLDDTVGAGGTFDTNNDSIGDNAAPGDWAGLIFRADANASLDFVDISHGGGTTVSGGSFKSFNPIEILQADVRITNSSIHDNASGFTTVSNRDGFGFNDDAAIFVRGSQPIILNNTIQANQGAAISINPNALDYSDVLDVGRSTGLIDVGVTDQDNQGPLIEGNRLDNNTFNALRVRSEILTTESIWDDTDIVHLVDGEIISLTHHFRSGLRLQSDPDQGLVVKFGPNGELKADGIPLDIEDRIGGTLQVIGTPGNPVILTSLSDNTVGAGFTPEGRPALDTLNQGAGAANLASAGDWLGLTIDTFANDRNVTHVLETEAGVPASNSENELATNAQYIGDLAPNELGGDENRRLGFTVRGTLADANDEDVYTFRATGGTTVYLDIDNTTLGFDSVLQLVDQNDQILAESDNSFKEATTLVTTNPNDPVRTLVNRSVASGTVLHPLFLSGVGNQEGPNPFDAGMRVILPGSASADDNEYFVRVKSKSGLTSGQYDLSVRLREADEVAGSTIQFADIRYATNAITVTGAPLHSPLTVDAQESLDYSTIIDPTPGNPQSGDEFVQESTNVGLSFTNNQADQLGNLETSDRGSLSITGDIGNLNSFDADVRLEDVDVYQVDLFAQQIEPDVFDSERRFVTVTFDVDYADGLGRPNTSLAVYNSFGQLVLHGRDSNIADDVGRPLKSVDSENLAAGSNGVLDAYIGPVEMPEGTYFVVVSNASVVPAALDQFFNPTPTDPLVRLMPINSVRRVVEDSLDGLIYTAEAPQTTLLDEGLFFTGPTFNFAPESIVPYTLDDIRLFVSLDTGISGNNNTALASFNPFSGTMERLIGQSVQPTDDLAIRDDGELFSFGLGPGTNVPEVQGNVGNQLNLSPVNGATTNVGDDALAFQRNNAAGTDLEADPNAQFDVSAIAFNTSPGSTIQSGPINANSRAFILGSRDTRGRGFEVPATLSRNLFYDYVIGTGAVTSRGSTNANAHRAFTGTLPYDTSQGPASVDREWGVVDTGSISGNGADGGDITGMSLIPGSFSDLIAVTDRGGVHTFDYRVNVPAPRSSEAFGYQGVIPTIYHGTVARDPEHVAATFSTQPPQFSGMSLGPPTIEGSAYENVIFATTSDGWLYALELDDAQNVQPASVFFNGRSAIPLTFVGGGSIGVSPHGLAFSHLEESPWNLTGDRFADDGHGIDVPFDQSRVPTSGATSLYYGFEVSGNPAENTISRADNDNRGELAPGGSHGSIISQSIDLEGYSPADKPTLYFNYLLEVENDDDYLRGVRLQNDSFRVFGAGDDGEWQLLATNNDYRRLPLGDEYDNFNETRIPVQELFDSAPGETAQWRQARVDLGPLAGSENVRIRFDFATSGSMRLQQGSIDFVAVPGDEVVDNEELRFFADGVAFTDPGSLVSFETVVGRDIVLPAGSLLSDGDQFGVTGPDGAFVVTFKTSLSVPAVDGEVLFTVGDSAIDIAAAVFKVLPKTLNPSDNLDGTLDVFAASDFVALGDAQIGQSNPVHVSPGALTGIPSVQLIIPEVEDLVDGEIIRILPGTGQLRGFDFDDDGIDFGIDASFNFGPDVDGNGVLDSIDAIATAIKFVRVPTGAADEVVFSAADSRDDIAARVIAQLPSNLTAVYEGDGRLTFLSVVEIDVQFGPSLIQLESSRTVVENRVTITPAQGDDLTNGETLTITSNSGASATLTFVDNLNAFVPNPVFFQAGETANLIAARLFDAIPDGFGAVLESATEVSLVAENVSLGGGALDFGLSPSTLVTVPDGINLINGEILRIATDAGPLDIPFIASAAPSPAGTVHFQPTDTQGDIQTRLLAAIASALQPVDAVASGADVLIYGIVDASSDQQLTTQILSAFQSGFNVVVPNGAQMTNNDTLDVTVGAATTTITFVEGAVAGPDQVNYLLTDTADVIAQRLQIALASFGSAIANGLGDTVFFAADSADYAAIVTLNQSSQDSLAYSVANIEIPNAEDLRNGEQVTIFSNGFNDPVITFVRRGTNIANLGTVPVYYDETDTPAGLYQQIIDAIGASDNVYLSPNNDGINVRSTFGSNFVSITNNPELTIQGTTTVDEAAVPLTVPVGTRIIDGEQITFTLKDFSAVTLTLREIPAGTGGPLDLTYDSTDSAADVAASLIQQLPIGLQGILTNTREILLLNVTSITTSATSSFIGFESIANATPIIVESTMTSREVATRIQSGFAEGFGRDEAADNVSKTSPDDFKVYGGDRIRLYNVTPLAAGSFGSSSYQLDAGGENPTFDTSPVPGDGFGEQAPIGIAASQITVNGASNNEVEGVYLDDFVIGFAERGEMVINAPLNNRTFVFNPETLPDTHPDAIQPERQNEALLGGYNLEIRTSDEYGVPEDYDPVNLELSDAFGLGRSFDTNDRLANGSVTIIAQPSTSLTDGDFFTINDGDRQMKFEFDDDGTVSPGSVRVPFNVGNSDPIIVARAIRNAINSPQVQSVLDVTAATSDSLELAFPSSDRVELFGDNISINHSGGRYLKVDLVAEETYQGRETSKQIPQVDHTQELVTDANFGDQLNRATVTQYVDGNVDTLVAVGKIGDVVNTGTAEGNLQDGAVLLANLPELDYDVVRIFLQENQIVDIDIDSLGFSKAGTADTLFSSGDLLDLPVISIFASRPFGQTNQITEVAQTSLITPSFAPGESIPGAFMEFTAPDTGYFDVVISSPALFGGIASSGEYQLTIRPHAETSDAVPENDVIMTDFQFGIGDKNRVSAQGQIVIAGNFIRDSLAIGISATNDARGETLVNSSGNLAIVTGPDALPRPGSAALLRNENTDELIPGVVISNNVITASGDVGIAFGGDTNADGQIAAPTLFGRIVNNTVVGIDSGIGDGIRISGSASPTVLNNVISFTDQGLVATANQTGEIVAGANAYQNNTTDSTIGLGNESIIVPDNVDLFQDRARRIYIPAAGSNIIDSSFASLTDRSGFLVTVKQPLGIAPSPIIAPNLDAYGQARVDDTTVTTPGGVGINVFIDRGAIDRADDERPIAVLVGPQDATGFAVPGGDQDIDSSFVRLEEGVVEFFDIQLTDESGTGPDTDTVTEENVILTENGRLLVPDEDYVFGYSANNRTIRLTPVAGLWRPDAVYQIVLNNRSSLKVAFPGGDGMVDGDQVVVTDINGDIQTLEFDSGFSLAVPQSSLLTVTGTNADVVEGQTFTIALAGGETRTLEIDRSGGVTAGNVPVMVAGAGTVVELRDAILAALNSVDLLLAPMTIAEALDLAPVAIGHSQIQLGTLAGHTLSGGFTSVNLSGQSGSAGDGDVISYDNGTTGVPATNFELTTDTLVSDPGFTPIMITRQDTPDQIAQKISEVLANTAGLGLGTAKAIGDGKVAVGGVVGDTLSITPITPDSLLASGQPGNTAGTTPIAFDPSSQFTPSSTAGAVQAALQAARLASTTVAETLSPGNGQLLVSNALSVQATFGGSPLVAIGNRLSAVSDLAGNPVRETRVNQETRFTIIMPEVVFDYGDAPDDGITFAYGTLEANNGARHTVDSGRSPRLGVNLDTETDGQPDTDGDSATGGDDAPLTVSAASTAAIFNTPVPTPSSTQTTITVTNNNANGGETVSVTVAGVITTFELTLPNTNPSFGNVAVPFEVGDLPATVASNLMAALEANIPSLNEAIDPVLDTATATITLTGTDDEDGVSVGTLITDDNETLFVFAVNGAANLNDLRDEDVLGFINPLDESGTTMAVNVVGSGLLDVWVDFDRNGQFESDEQVAKNQPVTQGPVTAGNENVPGVNLVNLPFLASQRAATAGDTWMRVRISEAGNLEPTGVSVGGEVEDYQISVRPSAPPVPQPNSYTVDEGVGTTLIVAGTDITDPLQGLIVNDDNLDEQILPVRFFIVDEPMHGTLLPITDANNGEPGNFTYIPDADYYGIDTFTYRLSTQQNADATSAAGADIATVTITVNPVNDAPAAATAPVTIIAIEDNGEQRFDKSVLLANAAGHADPNPDIDSDPDPDAPFDESNQLLEIVEIFVGDNDTNPIRTDVTVATPEGGSLRTEFSNGFLQAVYYTPGGRGQNGDDNFNSDIAGVLDTFRFNVQDDGLTELENGGTGPGLPVQKSVIPGVVNIFVQPSNDKPSLSADTVGIGDAITIDDSDYQGYYDSISQPAPIPTEDSTDPSNSPLIIPAAFLLENDQSGPDTAIDEVNFTNGNDGPMSIIGVSLVNPELGQIELLAGGNISFIPAEHVFGAVDFVYTVQDAGVDRDVNGDPTLRPEENSQQSTIIIEPTNDAPVAYDRSLSVAEAVETVDLPAVLPITRAQLINGAGITRSITGTDIVLTSGATMVDGETLTLNTADGLRTIVEFSTSNVASTGTDLLIQYAVTNTADEIALNLRDSLRAAGIGGTTAGSTVSFTTVSSISTSVNSTAVQADATDIIVVGGVELTGGETVTITDTSGRVQVFEFSETGFSVGSADVLVPYNDADDNTAVAASLRSALAGAGIGSAVQDGVPGESSVQFLSLSIAVDDTNSNITQSAAVLTLPAGVDFTNGETLTITDSNSIVNTVEFNTTGTPTAASNLVVTISDADTADTVAANFVSLLQGLFYGATASGADVTLHSVTSAVAAPPVSSIVTTSSSLDIPAGRSLIEGEIVTLAVSGGAPFVIEFNTTGTVSTGSDVAIRYAPGDIAQSIATQVAVALRINGFGATATGPTVDFATVNSVVAEELSAATGDFVQTLTSPYNEDDQTLDVVRFETDLDTVDVAVDGDGTHTLRTVRGGVLTVQFQNNVFVAGFYTPPVDYNQQVPFEANDLFTYVVEDSDGGQTLVAGTTRTVDLPPVRSAFPGTVTITVTPANDRPTFTTPVTIDIQEDDSDPGVNATGITKTNVIQSVLPSMATALDEIQNQTVSFEIFSSVLSPSGLMTAVPTINPDGSLTFFPAQDAVGTATYVIRGTDSGSLNVTGDEAFTDATIIVNVRPLNDAPRFDVDFVGNPGDPLTMDSASVDRTYVINREVDPNTNQITMAPITYAVREDGTLPIGSTNPDGSARTSEPFFIPFRQDPDSIGYKIPGLLDVFVAGPGNELDGTDGGNQSLTFFNSLPATTTFGGRLVSTSQNGRPGVAYTPPLNYNNAIGGPDSFVYTVRDKSSVGGETYNLDSQSLVDDPLTAINTIFFDLNPVNDRPEFTVVNPAPEAFEGAGRVMIPNFATNINAGPPASAFDEVDVLTGQDKQFSLSLQKAPETQSQQFFAELPQISPDGTLTFEALENVFGEFTFTVLLTDDGPGNETRGDLISSLRQEITLTIQPQNDPPVLDPGAAPLVFSLNEDGAIEIPVGDSATVGLLTPFLPGPANEGEDIDPGGNQTVSLATPITRSTAEGGTLTQVLDGNGNITDLLYTPRENFVGTDSFIYTVTDNGITIDINTSGAIQNDPKFASNIVTLQVAPINDEPLFSGANNVLVDEHVVGLLGPDPTTTAIPGWVNNIQPGPPTAADEASSQTVSFNIVQVDGNPDLLVAPPTVSPIGSTRDLQFQLTPSENGFAVFTVTAMDTGLNGGNLNHDNLSETKTFTIRVNAINDKPSFNEGGLVEQDERTSEGTSNEPYNQAWATNISPGPADEELQTVRFDVVTPAGQVDVFQTLPTIDSEGILRFATKLNANGRVDLIVRAIDSASPTVSVTPNNSVFSVETPSAVQTDITIVDGTAGGGETLDINVDGTVRTFELTLPNATPTGNNIAVPFSPGDSAATIASNLDAAIRNTDNGVPRIGEAITLTFDQATATLSLDVVDGVSDPVTLTIVIAEINTSPIAVADSLTTDEDTRYEFSSDLLLNNDIDFDLATNPSEVLRVELASTFSLSGAELSYDSATGVITYDPSGSTQLQSIAEGGTLTDSFSYSAIDAAGQESDRVTVSVLVNGINDRPTLADDMPTLNPNGTTPIRPLDNDFDIDGQIDPTSIVITLQPAFGSLDISNAGVITYTPFGNFSTEDTFGYTVADDLGLRSEQATITVSANAAPLALDDVARGFAREKPLQPGEQQPAEIVLELLPFDINVAANDSDPDRVDINAVDRGLDLGSIRIIVAPTRGEVVSLGNGQVTYSPTKIDINDRRDSLTGVVDQFQYVIADTEGRFSEAATVEIFVSRSRLQNPAIFEDVNADGEVSPLDALLVINRLAEAGANVPVVSTDVGPNYFDVNGDQQIRPSDILDVINRLAEQAVDDRGQGELISAIIQTSTEQNEDLPVQVDSALFGSQATKPVSVSPESVSTLNPGNSDLIDLIADRDENQDDEQERLNSLDAAFGDLI